MVEEESCDCREVSGKESSWVCEEKENWEEEAASEMKQVLEEKETFLISEKGMVLQSLGVQACDLSLFWWREVHDFWLLPDSHTMKRII